MIEAAMRRHRRFQGVFAGVAEGRMAYVVGEAQRLGQILVQSQRARDAAADLRDLETVGQADAVMVAVGGDEYLRLVAQAAKR